MTTPGGAASRPDAARNRALASASRSPSSWLDDGVAIPALIFWRYFRARVDDYLLGMELGSERFVRHLTQFLKK